MQPGCIKYEVECFYGQYGKRERKREREKRREFAPTRPACCLRFAVHISCHQGMMKMVKRGKHSSMVRIHRVVDNNTSSSYYETLEVLPIILALGNKNTPAVRLLGAYMPTCYGGLFFTAFFILFPILSENAPCGLIEYSLSEVM